MLIPPLMARLCAECGRKAAVSTYNYRVYNIEWFKKDNGRHGDLPREAIVTLSSHLVLGEGVRRADWVREIKDRLEHEIGARPKRFAFRPTQTFGGEA